MESMQHMHYQYAGQYWLTQALRNASGVLTDNIDEACLVWVDTYCYQQVSSLCPGRLVGAAGEPEHTSFKSSWSVLDCLFSCSLCAVVDYPESYQEARLAGLPSE